MSKNIKTYKIFNTFVNNSNKDGIKLFFLTKVIKMDIMTLYDYFLFSSTANKSKTHIPYLSKM